jgi:hypothetical protein
MTFDELFREFNITPSERRELVFYLAHLRMKKTIERLMSP